MGQQPESLQAVSYPAGEAHQHRASWSAAPAVKKLVGIDVFLDWEEGSPDDLGCRLLEGHMGD